MLKHARSCLAPLIFGIKALSALLLTFAVGSSQDLLAQNLLSNGSFEMDSTDWNNLAGDGGLARFTIRADDAMEGLHALNVEVDTLGTHPWSIQSIHSETSLTIGNSYVLAFYAKGDRGGLPLQAVIQNAPNLPYLARSFSLGTTWQKYEWVFTAAESSPQIKFQYPQQGLYSIDAVSLTDQLNSRLDFTVKPGTSFQTMVGFGGSLTWYADLITKSDKKSEMIDLLIKDAGTDLIRLKNWYYPEGYPLNKTPTTMEEGYFKGHFDATNELYALIKKANPQVEVLLSSWTPPRSLKSNNTQAQGTLKRNAAGQFMYAELGQYYRDVLDRISFKPDYFSFQNEPGFITKDWSTCEWRPTETADLPGYEQGLDAVYQALKSRPHSPKIIAPETENIGGAVWNGQLNTFREMSQRLKSKSYIHAYAYHLYNFAGNPGEIKPTNLNMIRDEFNDKPNFMTEFSSENFTWLDTADAIHQTLVEAHASAYLYWNLMWEAGSQSAILKVDSAGRYTISDQFYALKHYARFIDRGYKRIAVSGGNSLAKISGFLHPGARQITLVAINRSRSRQEIALNFSSGKVSKAVAYQSQAGRFFQPVQALDLGSPQFLPSLSLTTYVIDFHEAFAAEREP